MPAALPGCYAYGEAHLGGGVTLRQVSDYKGDELVSRFFEEFVDLWPHDRERVVAALMLLRRRPRSCGCPKGSSGRTPGRRHRPPPPRRELTVRTRWSR